MKQAILLFLIVSIVCSTNVYAQSLSFQINSISSTPQMTTGSLSFQVDSKNNCLYLANGLAIYKIPSTHFEMINGCSVPIQFDQYGLKIYPQPIGNNPRIQFGKSPNPNSIFTIRIFNIEGKLVLEDKMTGFTLSSGTTLNTNKLFAGSYVIQVISDLSIDIVQAIKQD